MIERHVRHAKSAKWPPTKPRETRDTVMRRRGCVARNREEEEKKEKTRPRWTKKSDSLFGRRRFFLLFFRECCDDYVLGGRSEVGLSSSKRRGLLARIFVVAMREKFGRKVCFDSLTSFLGEDYGVALCRKRSTFSQPRSDSVFLNRYRLFETEG